MLIFLQDTRQYVLGTANLRLSCGNSAWLSNCGDRAREHSVLDFETLRVCADDSGADRERDGRGVRLPHGQ